MVRMRSQATSRKSIKEPKSRVILDDSARKMALAITQLGLDKKAADIVAIDVRGLSSYAEYLVVMTADSQPQMNAIVGHVEEKLREQGERPLGTEGKDAGQWLLLDYGDVVLHVFEPEARVFYDLEGLWADAPRLEFSQA